MATKERKKDLFKHDWPKPKITDPDELIRLARESQEAVGVMHEEEDEE